MYAGRRSAPRCPADSNAPGTSSASGAAMREPRRDDEPQGRVGQRRQQRHHHPGRARPRPNGAGERGDDGEAEQEPEQLERGDQGRPRRGGADVTRATGASRSTRGARSGSRTRGSGSRRSGRTSGSSRWRRSRPTRRRGRRGRRSPPPSRAFLGRVGGEAEAGDGDERQRQQPDEEPVGERAGDDAAAELAVPVGHLEDDVEGCMSLSLDA